MSEPNETPKPRPESIVPLLLDTLAFLEDQCPDGQVAELAERVRDVLDNLPTEPDHHEAWELGTVCTEDGRPLVVVKAGMMVTQMTAVEALHLAARFDVTAQTAMGRASFYQWLCRYTSMPEDKRPTALWQYDQARINVMKGETV